MSDNKYMTTPPEIDHMPPGVPYIVGNEAAERFSYYGMRGILVVFLTEYLHLMSDQVLPEMSEAEARAHYHTFSSLVYLFPIVGALLADALTGKYVLILWLSVVYCLGHLALAFVGSPGMSPENYMWLGLILIAVGSGGIKPCVSAHVGDQFGKKNEHLMSKVFQWFYFSINLGSTASFILIPILLKWYGPHVAFGIPGVLMAVATVVFWMGRNVFVHIPPARQTLFRDLFSAHGVTTLLKISLVFVFASVFWALFDQTSSAWVLQAENMNRSLLGFEVLKEQIQLVNPVLVMLMIPLFQMVIYPAIDRVFPLSHLRKYSMGLFLAAASFAVSAIIEQWIAEGGTPSILWQVLAYVFITAGEIMVSITGLEFSYAQAPKSMKSIVMSLWLAFIAFGNILTAELNHWIQVPSINAVITEAKHFDEPGMNREIGHDWQVRTVAKRDEMPAEIVKVIEVAGYDGEFGTPDDFELQFAEFDALKKLTTPQDQSLQAAFEAIEQSFFDSGEVLPSSSAGQKLLSEYQDTHGQPLRYEQVTRDRFRITSSGADEQFDTQWDVRLLATVSRVDPDKSSQQSEQPLTWLERRIIELKGEEGRAQVLAARGDIPTTKISSEITVGGAVTLEGPAYYWFWTHMMLVTAVLFIPVAYFYREQPRVLNEQESENIAEEALEEGTDAR